MTKSHLFSPAEVSLQGDRKNNQDRSIVLSDGGTVLVVLADGLGGHPKGEVAAQILINTSKHLFSQLVKPVSSPESFMQACIQRAHKAILDYGNRQEPVISPRTTAVLAMIQNGMIYWAHVGDSRFYLIRNKRIVAQTRDHSLAQLTETIREEAEFDLSKYNKNAITRCLGGISATPSITLGAPSMLSTGDYVLLCSDGFWNQLETSDLETGLDEDINFQSALAKLAQQAAILGKPNSDNVTVAGVCWHGRGSDGLELDPSNPSGYDQNLDEALDHLLGLIHSDPKA